MFSDPNNEFVTCVEDGGYRYITNGKIYEVLFEFDVNSTPTYHITDDEGKSGFYPTTLFKTKSQMRDGKLKDILK